MFLEELYKLVILKKLILSNKNKVNLGIIEEVAHSEPKEKQVGIE